jgi:hypothetical protein
MTVADLLPRLPLTYEEGRTYGLVFDAALAQRLAEVQAESPSQFVAQPVPLVDGRYLLCGDLLSEVPNGLYGIGFGRLDASRFDEIEVIAWDDAVALLPPDPPVPYPPLPA